MKRVFVVIGGGTVAVAAVALALVADRPPSAVRYTSRPAATPAASVPPSPVVAGMNTGGPVEPAAPPPTRTAVARPAAPAPTPVPTPTPVPVPSVTLTIVEPDGNFTFAVPATNVTDACNILTAAKGQGFLRSVTLDYSYMSSLHSAYVREINGYENSWEFKVNGASPKGCSLAQVTEGDTVSWTYQ